MDNRAIGVFDSGLGGLTALRELKRLLPNEKLVYFSDTGRVPYGPRGKEVITQYSKQIVRFLQKHDVKMIVAACGTVSSVSLDIIKDTFEVPIVGVIESATKAAAKVTKNGRIGVIGTAGTIRSGSYEKSLRKIDNNFEIFAAACPLFVPLVENGRYRKDDIVVTTVAREYLEPILKNEIDTLILGCTHYPLIEEVIRDICGDAVATISPGLHTSEYVKELLSERNMERVGDGECSFYVSDIASDFKELAETFLGETINSSVTKIDIERY